MFPKHLCNISFHLSPMGLLKPSTSWGVMQPSSRLCSSYCRSWYTDAGAIVKDCGKIMPKPYGALFLLYCSAFWPIHTSHTHAHICTYIYYLCIYLNLATKKFYIFSVLSPTEWNLYTVTSTQWKIGVHLMYFQQKEKKDPNCLHNNYKCWNTIIINNIST